MLGETLQKSQDLEEGRGFEPLKAFTLTVFKTVAIDHSAIPPAGGGVYLLGFVFALG